MENCLVTENLSKYFNLPVKTVILSQLFARQHMRVCYMQVQTVSESCDRNLNFQVFVNQVENAIFGPAA